MNIYQSIIILQTSPPATLIQAHWSEEAADRNESQLPAQVRQQVSDPTSQRV